MLKFYRRSLVILTVRLAVTLALSMLLMVGGVAVPLASAQQGPINFNLRTTDGGQISAEMLRGDVVVLAFSPSSLPLSRALLPGVQELADKYRDRNVRIYWVSTDSNSPNSKNYATDAQLRAFAEKYGLKVGVLRDPEGVLFKQVGADQLPALVILDREGNVSGAPIGGLDPRGKLIDKLAPRLNPLL
ncbi:MAG: TlpA family protein disulfide reductase [Pyrinomonadaceae bacterium]|nr:TlpA family protein disulfide reductase [Pyrinomonadaceae bacterium]